MIDDLANHGGIHPGAAVVVAQGAVVRVAVLVRIAIAVAFDTLRGRVAENM